MIEKIIHYSIGYARDRFGSVVNKVIDDMEPVIITKRLEPVVVIVPIETYKYFIQSAEQLQELKHQIDKEVRESQKC